MPSENTRRIAKNTAMLYIRMLLTMAVTLYTSRVVLNVLGVEDFGIYNVVGGIVVMFSFLNAAMLLSNQRFLSFELGRNDEKRVAQVYRASMKLYWCIALVMFILAETIGLWFLNNYLNIPSQKIVAANWVYQFSVIVVVVGILRNPYNALIVAYERMSFFAYISFGEVVLKLIVVYLLFITSSDKLICYSALTALMMVVITFMYKIYCYSHFSAIRKKYKTDKLLFRELISFSGWSLGLGVSNLAVTQGTNIIFNIFYGVVVNAAMGITNQVYTAISQFVSNFQTALNPQLIKSYASNEHEHLFSLLYKGSKFSFFLMLFLSWPVIINTEYILSVWLKVVPPYTARFVQLILFYGLVDTLINPLAVVVQASGIIRRYQIVCSVMMLLNIPLIFLLIYCSVSPVYVFAGRLFINVISLVWRLFYFRSNFGMHFTDYWRNVLKGIVLAGTSAILLSSIPVFYFEHLTRLLVSSLSWVITFSLLVWFVGISKSDQVYLRECWQGLCRKLKI